MHFIAHSQIRSEVHSWLSSIAHSVPAWLTLPIKLAKRSEVHSRACSQGRSQLHSMAPSQPAWLYAPKKAHKTLWSTLPSTLWSTLSLVLNDTLLACLTVCAQLRSQDNPNRTQWHTPSLLDRMFPSTLSRRSQSHSMAHSQPAWLYAPKWALEMLSSTLPSTLSTTLPIALDDTPSPLGSTLRNTLSRGKTLPISVDYMLTCILLCARSRDSLSCRHQAPAGVRLLAGGG